MAAYVIVEVSVKDPAIYEEYRKLTPGSVAAFDGKFRVRGGEVFSLEGDWDGYFLYFYNTGFNAQVINSEAKRWTMVRDYQSLISCI